MLIINNLYNSKLIIKKKICGPRGGDGRGLPNEAMLQFALLPSITGFGLAQALLADSGSRKVTYFSINHSNQKILHDIK